MDVLPFILDFKAGFHHRSTNTHPNWVEAEFIDPSGQVSHTVVFDFKDEHARRALGKVCSVVYLSSDFWSILTHKHRPVVDGVTIRPAEGFMYKGWYYVSGTQTGRTYTDTPNIKEVPRKD